MIRSGWPDRVTVWRWHFYAGLLCIPVVLWLAATGSIYLFKPQIDAWLDRPYGSLDLTGSAASPAAQVSAALAAVPGSVLNAYELPGNPHSAVLIDSLKDLQGDRVHIDPLELGATAHQHLDRRMRIPG